MQTYKNNAELDKYLELNLLIVISLPVASLLGYLQKNILGLPNLYSALRDCLILAFFFLSLFKFNGLIGSRKILALLCYVFFVIYYCVIFLFESKVYEGLYFLRLYSLPILFFLISITVVENSSNRFLQKAVRFIVVMNIIVNIIAILLYAEFVNNVAFKIRLMGANAFHTAWNISGSHIMRLGLPLSGPNTMGLYLAVNIFLFIVFLREEILQSKKIYLLVIVNLILLILTFSRSSILFLVIAFSILAIYKIKAFFLRYVKYVLMSLCIIFIGYAVIDRQSDGTVSNWVSLNVSLQDPSIQGHSESVFDAIQNMGKYILTGYPKGTVSSKSFLFTENIINVENSFLTVMYDAGFIGFSIIMLTYFFLIRHTTQGINQVSFIMAFIIVLQFLPHLFETEIIMYSIFIFAIMGKLAPAKALSEDFSINTNDLQVIKS